MAAATEQSSTFAALAEQDQDSVLDELDQMHHPLLQWLIVATMEGFYGDPRHGGNDGAISWKMLGFSGPAYPRGYEPPLGYYDATVPDREPQ
jgi:gluconate 2-dehydrogenase gamma chain